jgi:hypothetical protein
VGGRSPFALVILPADPRAFRCLISHRNGPFKNDKITQTARFKKRLGLAYPTSGSQRLDIRGRRFFDPDLAAFFDKL